MATLARLPIKPASSTHAYQRTADFGAAWAHPLSGSCDTRDQILSRDLTGVSVSGCKVESGSLHDPYTGATIAFRRGQTTSALVQIDHVVPLGDIWVTGGEALSQAQREAIANDPANLLAVDEHSNESKSDKDASEWMPPLASFDCTYVSIQVDVKAKYGLWVTKAEHDAMARVLSGCGASSTQTHASAAAAQPAGAAAAPAAPEPARGASAPAGVSAHPGAFCSPAGAKRIDSGNGVTYTCKTSATDTRNRWRR